MQLTGTALMTISLGDPILRCYDEQGKNNGLFFRLLNVLKRAGQACQAGCLGTRFVGHGMRLCKGAPDVYNTIEGGSYGGNERRLCQTGSWADFALG